MRAGTRTRRWDQVKMKGLKSQIVMRMRACSRSVEVTKSSMSARGETPSSFRKQKENRVDSNQTEIERTKSG